MVKRDTKDIEGENNKILLCHVFKKRATADILICDNLEENAV